MKYAIVDDRKTEAKKGILGKCPSCGAVLVPKCGELRINHWSHKGKRSCDPWWENETEWHRSWKGNFPVDWQEVIHFDHSGEKHIADVKTSSEWVLEFQHSFLDPDERRARNAFFGKIVWVVDGTRRKTDQGQFEKWISTGTRVSPNNPIFRATFPEECRPLREWQDERAIVFLDFGQATPEGDSLLWLVFPKISHQTAYVSWFSKRRFVAMHNDGQFDRFVQEELNEIVKIIKEGLDRASLANRHPVFLTAAEKRLRARPRRGM